jgi:hypothetical protein
MAKAKKAKVAKKAVPKVKEHHSGLPVPKGASDKKNPSVPLENAVNPTSPIYQE